VRLALGIAPLCAAIGVLTPMLVDRWSRGDPRRAGGVYAMNIIGCVLGPLLASFVLLPWLGERASLVALCAPLAAVAAVLARRQPARAPRAALVAAAGSLRSSRYGRRISRQTTFSPWCGAITPQPSSPRERTTGRWICS